MLDLHRFGTFIIYCCAFHGQSRCLVLTALATGLVFAKFSRPTARIFFARNATIHPFNGVPTLVFRVGNERATDDGGALRLPPGHGYCARAGANVKNRTPGEDRLKLLLKVSPHTACPTGMGCESIVSRNDCQSVSVMLDMVGRPIPCQVA